MALSISITITIIILHIFFVQKKKLSFLQNSIVFMVMVLIIRNYLTIMNMELNLIKTTENHILFVYFLIQREIIIPILTLIFVNTYLQTFSWKGKTFLFIGIFSILYGINYLAIYFEIIKFVQWNFFNSVIIDILYLIISLAVAKIVLFLQHGESKKNDNRL